MSPATGAARAGEIWRTFELHQMDPEWCLPSKLDDNPLAWLITVNGFAMDARYAPREVQEEALRLQAGVSIGLRVLKGCFKALWGVVVAHAARVGRLSSKVWRSPPW